MYEHLLGALSDPVCWVLQGWLHQSMGVAILISSSRSLVCARHQILAGPVMQHFLLLCRHKGIFLLWFILVREHLKVTANERNQNPKHYDTLSLSLSLFLNNILKWKMYWFFSDIFILSPAKNDWFSSPWLLAAFATGFSPFKKQAVVHNQWVINYWGCAGWQDTRPVLFARGIICSQDAGHVII